MTQRFAAKTSCEPHSRNYSVDQNEGFPDHKLRCLIRIEWDLKERLKDNLMSDAAGFFAILIWLANLLVAAMGGQLANKKRRSVGAWFVICLFTSLLGLLILAVLPSRLEKDRKNEGNEALTRANLRNPSISRSPIESDGTLNRNLEKMLQYALNYSVWKVIMGACGGAIMGLVVVQISEPRWFILYYDGTLTGEAKIIFLLTILGALIGIGWGIVTQKPDSHR